MQKCLHRIEGDGIWLNQGKQWACLTLVVWQHHLGAFQQTVQQYPYGVTQDRRMDFKHGTREHHHRGYLAESCGVGSRRPITGWEENLEKDPGRIASLWAWVSETLTSDTKGGASLTAKYTVFVSSNVTTQPFTSITAQNLASTHHYRTNQGQHRPHICNLCRRYEPEKKQNHEHKRYVHWRFWHYQLFYSLAGFNVRAKQCRKKSR